MAAVEVGQSYKSSITVTDSTSAAVNPATVVLTVTLPDQTFETPTIVNDSTGNYHVDYTLTQEGLYRFSWVTQTPYTAETDYVNANAFRSIIGINDAKNYINFDSSGNESILRQMMATATELIEEVVGVCVIRTFTDKRIVGRTAQVIRLPNSPLVDETSLTSVTSVYPGGPFWTQANGNFIVYPDSATAELTNYLPFYLGPWKATYVAGRAVIPAKFQLAAKEILYDLWPTQRPYGLDQLEPGPEDTARWEQMLATYKMPPHAREMLRGEERPGFR